MPWMSRPIRREWQRTYCLMRPVGAPASHPPERLIGGVERIGSRRSLSALCRLLADLMLWRARALRVPERPPRTSLPCWACYPRATPASQPLSGGGCKEAIVRSITSGTADDGALWLGMPRWASSPLGCPVHREVTTLRSLTNVRPGISHRSIEKEVGNVRIHDALPCADRGVPGDAQGGPGGA